MMKLAFENIITPSQMGELEKRADDAIHVRGYQPSCDIPAHLRKTEWELPFSTIPIKYCPTDRYAYLNKYESQVRRQQSWEALQGQIIDDLYDKFIKELHLYLNTEKLVNMDVAANLQKFSKEFLSNTRSKIDTRCAKLLNPPNTSDIENLEQLIEKTLRYEVGLASALVDYKISVISALNTASILATLFPFVVKPSYTVGSFGISNIAQPDFLFDNKVIIDVKAPPWNDDFLNTLGGYALVHEKMNKKPINLGMIVTPVYHQKRNVPHLFKSEIILIDDIYRKAFILRRDKLLTIIKNQSDPGVPDNNFKCKSCGYYNHCWPDA